MRAQRETWIQDLDGRADYKFFLGLPESADEDVVSLDMPDGPIWDAVRGCGHRTPVGQRKTEALARYALENGYDFVFKCDDDTFIRVDHLLAGGFERFDYSGFTEQHWERDIAWYRWCQGGAGYWLSRKAMALVAEYGLHLVPIEDYAVGQLLHRHEIMPYHDARYTPTPDPRRPDWITAHQVEPDRMYALAASLPKPEAVTTTVSDHAEDVIDRSS